MCHKVSNVIIHALARFETDLTYVEVLSVSLGSQRFIVKEVCCPYANCMDASTFRFVICFDTLA